MSETVEITPQQHFEGQNNNECSHNLTSVPPPAKPSSLS
jgi:hypothetical protein